MKNSGKTLFEKAEKHRKSAEYKKAIELYQKALAHFKKASDPDGTLDCIISLADTFRAKGEFINAKKYYEEGLELANILSDKSSAADALAGLGLSLRALGNWKDALTLIGKANRSYKSLHDRRGEAFSIWARGGAYRIRER